ncbi:hybrid sensor histidine kinase/response regulator [Leadbettera azotonutricia]|uniref:histidine kinase n=1 Tax=Leadbettera azotonutricia (strain ATCC BAA-888 / DSM 13862 / ZAS-9) TaxID=545695 RepID=F5Y8T7_LEAAZ|nr:response regulator [Leadbettera azotonutricia]AEF80679.1 PAS/PAC sensor hybrid histidine kinase [Leadbettera azotonutricia ZAS-9]
MSIRIKIVLIIASIVALITASSFVISLYFDRLHLVETIKSDMTVVSRIAEKLVATNLRLMKIEADVAAAEILKAAMNDAASSEGQILKMALTDQAQEHNYLSLAILSSRGAVASYGFPVPGQDFVRSAYARRAFVGERVITTTELDPGGELVIRICVPMGSRILVATLPGMILSDILDDFRIWNSGNILLLDGEGVIIANIRPFLVEERHILLDVMDPGPEGEEREGFIRGIRTGEAGAGIYSYGGVPRVGAYMPVSGSDDWTLIVAAPIDESPGAMNRNILLISAAIFMSLGILAAFVAANFIVIPFKKIQEQNVRLAELRETAESASRAKGDFLSNMSHEMRTPMNAIIGMTSIAKTSHAIERKDYCLSKIEDASTHLLGVINDILDMSKIEANKFDLSPVEFNFEKMLQKTVNVISFRVDQKQQKFRVRVDKNIPPFLIADDQRLTQVIANLLSNAVKFTPERGSVWLDAKWIGEQDGICTIEISVTDSGIGISAEQQAKLFTSFTQAESATSRKFGGTGLGLAISKRIVEMMNGRIWIESELGKGSAFIFTIEAVKVSKAATAPEIPVTDRKSFKVLAVDDDPETREYFGEIMLHYGFTCDLASGAEEAQGLIEKNGPYSLYFIDYKMPGINGIELSKWIKERETQEAASPPKKTVVIMISATEWSMIENEAKNAGVEHFLSKPFFPSSIVDYINEYLGLDHHLAQKKEADDDSGCFEGFCILLAEDVQINREIVLALLEPTALVIDCASNGVEALKMFSEAPDKYAMIFMDVQMPEMDGLEATRCIRAFEEKRFEGMASAKRVPIVAMTANVFREDIERCLASGMNDHVGKPIDISEVMRKLRQYLNAAQRV